MGGTTLIAIPYDSGRFDERMGCGPLHLLRSGLAERLRAQQQAVDVVTIQLPAGFYSGAQALVALQQRTVEALRESLARDRRIFVLSGNCGPAALSASAALTPRKTGVIWFDAHADFNTPETSASGFLDGMSLAILTGRCWPALAARFAGFKPVPETNVILVGTRDLDSPETAALSESSITRVPPGRTDLFEAAVATLLEQVEDFYIHLDVDVLDESEGCANSYASGGGLSADELYAALEVLQRSGRIKVAGITSYDPASDHDGRIRTIIDKAAAIFAGSSCRQ
jgi:arginase